MSDEVMSPGASPSSPAGVRRLNKLPLVIFLAIAVAVMGAVMYSFYKRSQDQQAAAKDEQVVEPPGSDSSALDAVLAGYDGEFIERPYIADPPMITAADVDDPDSDGGAPVVSGSGVPVVVEKEPEGVDFDALAQQARDEAVLRALQAELARQQAMKDQIDQALLAAMQADTSVGDGGGSSSGGADAMSEQEKQRAKYEQLHKQAVAQAQPDMSSSIKMLVSALQGSGGNAGGANESNPVRSATSLAGLNAALGGSSAGGERANGMDDGEYGYSDKKRVAQRIETELRVGTVIPAVMISGINSDLPGEMIAQVSEDVRDTRTGMHILIPKGSKLVGRYSSDVDDGQERVFVAWYRINYPDGSALNLDGFGGMDQGGYSGFNDQVDNHTVDKFKEATLLSLISGAAQLSQSDSEQGSEAAAALGQQYSKVGEEIIKKKLEMPPTLVIRAGYRFNVFIKKDLMLKPYAPMAPMESPMSLRG